MGQQLWQEKLLIRLFNAGVLNQVNSMKVIECGPKNNRVWYLTVHTFLPRKLFAMLLKRLPDVEIIRGPKLFSILREDEFLEFSFKDEIYCVEVDPFSKSYFEIHLKKPGCKPETLELKEQLENVRFSFF